MKKVFAIVLSLAIVSGLFGSVGAVGASPVPVDPVDTVDQIVQSSVPTDQGVPTDLIVPRADQRSTSELVSPLADIDIPLSGGFSSASYYASGGRVDIKVDQLYLNPTDARAYATKSEQSLWTGLAWFGSSFIPVAGPYLSTLGLLSTINDAMFVSSIRSYADANQSVIIVISHDRFYGTVTRGAAYWNGMKDQVKSNTSLNQAYKVSSYVTYKY